MSQNILIIEDETLVSDLIITILVKEGYYPILAKTGAEALKKISQVVPDLILLDIGLPDMEGLEIPKFIRKSKKTADLPIIIITGRNTLKDRLSGFEHGADDYLAKPFEPQELVARIRAVLKRIPVKSKQPQTQTTYGEKLFMDSEKHEVWHDGKEVWLTPKEFSLLEFFIKHMGKVQSRQTILKEIWGHVSDDPTRTVDVHVRRLRAKIPILENDLITIKPMGYKLREPVLS
ncbi:MAG: response regulator transcription factor [Nitrospirae bacterium]|nr:response regulator transcription factor [Nitrospirota bacterium]MBI3351418.1 response regulator transcription factor [Nitrospirota bacterium]